MTHLGTFLTALLFASAAMAAEPLVPSDGDGAAVGDALRLLTPRDGAPVAVPPLSDAYRCEPVLRIDEGTPVSLVVPQDGQGTDSRETNRLCVD